MNYIKTAVLIPSYTDPDHEAAGQQTNVDSIAIALESEGLTLDDGNLTHTKTRVPPTLTIRSGMGARVVTEWRRK